jgi:5-deoxy-glucuronate isomerase
MSKLLVHSRETADPSGILLSVTPESANWKYVGFEVAALKKGQSLRKVTGEREYCVVLLSGKASVGTSKAFWENIGERMNIFEKTPPYSVYVPSDDHFEITAVTDLEVALCSAPGKGTHEARLIAPADVGAEVRGTGRMERLIHNILPENEPADSLLIVEVYTPNGNWSSYPPHKHDTNDLPNETYLEETYYHRLENDKGFAIQRVYTKDGSLDESMTVKNGDLVLVPKGFHSVSAPPGYDLYYLNVMAGPVRTWKLFNDPDHEWLRK